MALVPNASTDLEGSDIVAGGGGPRVSCSVSGSEWKICKYCDPDYPDFCVHKPAEGCKCRDINLNSTGKYTLPRF